MESKRFYFDHIIKISSQYVVVLLSSNGDHFIDDQTLYKLTEQSLPSIKDLKIIYQKTLKNNDFRTLINQEEISLEELESQLNGYLTKHYAILKKNELMTLMICSAIDTLKVKKKELNIAIDGNSTSGKTTFSNHLKTIYACNVFHMDDFFKKPDNQQLKSTYANNIDFARLRKEVINPVEKHEIIHYQELDLSTHSLKKPIKIDYKPLNIIEGAFSMHPNIIDFYDLKIFMKASYQRQIRRIFKRNGLKKLLEFMHRWIPNENRYIRDLNIKDQADFIIELKHF